jgi:fructose-bisphosphate aldolase class 1
MVANGKGLLAADESTGTIGNRFEKIGVANTLENRVAYREALFSAPGAQLAEYIGGVILYEETLDSKGSDGRMLVDLLKDRKIILGIKTDKGTKLSKKKKKKKKRKAFLVRQSENFVQRVEMIYSSACNLISSKNENRV